MYSKPQHSIDEALNKFDLVDGVGNGKNTACAVSMLGWIAGHKQWNDEPVCANSDIAKTVIDGNDWKDPKLPRFKTKNPYDKNYMRYTKQSEDKIKERRANLVKLGFDGLLDTWWIPDDIIQWLMETTYEESNPYASAVNLLKATAKWKKTRHRMAYVFNEQVEHHIWMRVS